MRGAGEMEIGRLVEADWRLMVSHEAEKINLNFP